MSSIMKVFLLLAVIVCISKAQNREAGQHCLCNSFTGLGGLKSEIKDIQIYRATIFCNRVEIVVTLNNGLRCCLNPKVNTVRRLLAFMINKQKTSTMSPAVLSSTPASTNTARI